MIQISDVHPIGFDMVFVTEVIITTTKRRGKGTHSDPVRVITEVFTKDGIKIGERDPMWFDEKNQLS
jgi:hypothetical protein